MPIPNKIAFEQRYSDDSGVQYGVRYNADKPASEIEIEAVDTVHLPADELDWLIESLQAIREIVRAARPTPEGAE